MVFRSDHTGALIDIGAKAPAFLPLAEACIHRVKSVEDVGLAPGAAEEFVIVRDDDDRGRMILSLKKLQYDLAWERCRQLQADDISVRGKVLSINRGGMLVQCEGLRGFVPMSHVALRTPREELMEREIPLKFLEVDEERTRLVLSNRRAMAENQLQTFNVGDVVVGTVQAVKPYGAFIDIGGINGLLHISQISADRITDVGTVLSEGDQLKVMILSQDRDRGRISLSTKKLEPTPGDMLRNPALVYEKVQYSAMEGLCIDFAFGQDYQCQLLAGTLELRFELRRGSVLSRQWSHGLPLAQADEMARTLKDKLAEIAKAAKSYSPENDLGLEGLDSVDMSSAVE
eukprot:SM000208S06309  [mRNA]  locus=s208:65115:66894:- [translate_table: standard]